MAPLYMHRRRGMSFLVLLLAGAASTVAFAAPVKDGLCGDDHRKPWRVEYQSYGGFAGVLQQVTVADNGQVMVTTGDVFAAPVRFEATADEMAGVVAALRRLKLPVPPPAPLPADAMPDAPRTSLNVTCGGKFYPIGSSGADLLAALEPIQKRGLRLAPGAKEAQAEPTLKPWAVEFAYSGGLAGLAVHIAVTDTGEVTLRNRIYQPEETRFTVTASEMKEILAALRKLNLTGPPQQLPPFKPMPDAITGSLEIVYGGQRYPFAPKASTLPAVLAPIITRGMNLITEAKWAKAGPFQAGRAWVVQLEVRDARGYFHGEYWNAVWTRRSDSGAFDAVWRNSRTNEEVHDLVILDSVERGHVALHRPSQNQRLEGSYRAESPDRIFGNVVSQTVLGCPGCSGPYWQATVKYQ